jgi:hypothetical protein
VNDWAAQELQLLRRCWPSLIHDENSNWCKIPVFVVPPGWQTSTADVAFQIPDGLPGQAPYGLLVRGGLTLASGATPSNYTFPVAPTPWGGDWGQFSLQLEPWAPGAQPGDGTSMVDFVRSLTGRLLELT